MGWKLWRVFCLFVKEVVILEVAIEKVNHWLHRQLRSAKLRINKIWQKCLYFQYNWIYRHTFTLLSISNRSCNCFVESLKFIRVYYLFTWQRQWCEFLSHTQVTVFIFCRSSAFLHKLFIDLTLLQSTFNRSNAKNVFACHYLLR